MAKLSFRLLVVVGVLAIAAEIILRLGWGLGTMLLYQGDSSFEYIAKPNQDLTRFGQRMLVNEYSMRSNPLSDDDKCVVLGFGDSVINGGTLTDQDSIATTIVEKTLRKDINPATRFLNISAGSWGPDNCAAYLTKFGGFNAKAIVLFVSSHDAHDIMTFDNIVGVHDSYPEKQYPLAIIEVIDRYLIPRLESYLGNTSSANDLMINKDGVGFNTGFESIRNFCQSNAIPMIVCLHAEIEEVENRSYNEQGKEILAFCSKNGIQVISGLEIGESATDYRDQIHINERGQKKWARVLSKSLESIVKNCM